MTDEKLPPEGAAGPERQSSPPDDNYEIDREPIYYYNREHRLSRASQSVRDHNEEGSGKARAKGGFFGSRSNSMVFITIILIIVGFGVISRLQQRERGFTLGGNKLTLLIFEEEGVYLLGIVKSAPLNGNAYTGAVDLAVSPENEETPPVFNHRIYFGPGESELFRITIPFSGRNFLVLLTNGEESVTGKISVTDVKNN